MPTLSKAVGKILCSLNGPNIEVVLANECGGHERIEFFFAEPSCRKTSVVWVDAAIVVNSEIKVVVEIEESLISPMQFCGKIFGTAIAKFYKGKRGKYPLSDALFFIQILAKKPKNLEGSKREQCWNLADRIPEVLTPDRTRIARYKFHWGTAEEFSTDPLHGEDLIGEIRDFLNLASESISKVQGCDSAHIDSANYKL